MAAPGDVISIADGHVIRNGKREADSYIRPCEGASATPRCYLAGACPGNPVTGADGSEGSCMA